MSGCGWSSGLALLGPRAPGCMWGIAQRICSPFLLPVWPLTPSFWSVPPRTVVSQKPKWDTCWIRCAPGRRMRAVLLMCRPAMDERPVRAGTRLAFAQVSILSPRFEQRGPKEPLSLWAVRVWEEESPEGEAPLEWILLTSVPTRTLQEAWQRGEWYACRGTRRSVSPMPQNGLPDRASVRCKARHA